MGESNTLSGEKAHAGPKGFTRVWLSVRERVKEGGALGCAAFGAAILCKNDAHRGSKVGKLRRTPLEEGEGKKVAKGVPSVQLRTQKVSITWVGLSKLSVRKLLTLFSKSFKMRRQAKLQISLKSYSKNLSDSNRIHWETSKNSHPKTFFQF